jgi:hypothetical protein
VTGTSWRYDARLLATNPHLVPEFTEAADDFYEDDEPLADILDAFEHGEPLVTAPAGGA